MKIFKIIVKALISPLDIIGSMKAAEYLPVSLAIAGLCLLLDTVALPYGYYLTFRQKYDIDLSIGMITAMFFTGTLTFLASILIFRGVSKVCGKKAGFVEIIATWGLSFIPDLFCILLYGALQLKLVELQGNRLLAVVVSTFFILFLIWKAIFYLIEMRYVLKLEFTQLIIATAVIGIVYIGLMSAGFAVGIQVPFL